MCAAAALLFRSKTNVPHRRGRQRWPCCRMRHSTAAAQCATGQATTHADPDWPPAARSTPLRRQRRSCMAQLEPAGGTFVHRGAEQRQTRCEATNSAPPEQPVRQSRGAGNTALRRSTQPSAKRSLRSRGRSASHRRRGRAQRSPTPQRQTRLSNPPRAFTGRAFLQVEAVLRSGSHVRSKITMASGCAKTLRTYERCGR